MGHFDSLAAVALAARPSMEQPRRFYRPMRHGTEEAVRMLLAFVRRTSSPPVLFNTVYCLHKQQIEHRACLWPAPLRHGVVKTFEANTPSRISRESPLKREHGVSSRTHRLLLITGYILHYHYYYLCALRQMSANNVWQSRLKWVTSR